MPRSAHRTALLLPAAAVLATLSACGGGSSSTSPAPLVIAVLAPTSADPYLAQTLHRGTDLAMRELNAGGGVSIGGSKRHVELRTYDDGLDAQRTRSAVQSAIHDGAAGIVTDGYGAAAAAQDSAAAGVPIIVINNGDATLMDPKARPSLFRIGIANDAATSILSKYVAQSAKAPAIVHDDTDYGRDGATQLQQALPTAGLHPTTTLEIAKDVPAVDAQVRAVLDAHSDALIVWGTDTFVARVVSAAHTASASLPVFTGPTGESPAVRAVAGADATEGLRFIDSRTTSESDSVSFGQFEHRLAAAAGGPTDAGVKDREGRAIRLPADGEVFSYDAVNLLAAAAGKLGSVQPSSKLVDLMTQTRVHSANGDARGFNPDNHEGVADDDLYIARIHDMQFAPVKDEALSATLPSEDQILANFH
ncbi:MAG TPA: ABC transporter substrate-binding protein [Candidatus Dormibacteraeota bacterium]|jgi:branched-chain amino acid transport system substrate-binding protein|nr:ABC transporter substrate-binding protein [Candidatus Dormibacteraeota bacterium]